MKGQGGGAGGVVWEGRGSEGHGGPRTKDSDLSPASVASELKDRRRRRRPLAPAASPPPTPPTPPPTTPTPTTSESHVLFCPFFFLWNHLFRSISFGRFVPTPPPTKNRKQKKKGRGHCDSINRRSINRRPPVREGAAQRRNPPRSNRI